MLGRIEGWTAEDIQDEGRKKKKGGKELMM